MSGIGTRKICCLALLSLASAVMPAFGANASDDSSARPAAPESRPPDKAQVEFFEQHIRPLLVEHCYKCHSHQAKNLRGGLLLDSRAGWVKGGDNGPAIIPGKPDESLLIKAVRYQDDLKMPPKGKLTPKQIDLLVQWVRQGAPDPRHDAAAPAMRQTIDVAQGRSHWAFLPLRTVIPPRVSDQAGWCRTPLDRFILAKLK